MVKRNYSNKNDAIRAVDITAPKRKRPHRDERTKGVDRTATGKAVITRYRAAVECTLDTYLQRGTITQEEHRAGKRFRSAYLRAVFGVKVADVGGGNQGDKEMSFLTPIYSEQLLKEAARVLTLPQEAVLISVCGFDEWAGNFRRLKALRNGLDALAVRWGFKTKGWF